MSVRWLYLIALAVSACVMASSAREDVSTVSHSETATWLVPFDVGPSLDGGWTTNVQFFGDSITAGSNAPWAYPVVVRMMGGNRYRVNSQGFPGQGCKSIAQQAIFDGRAPPPLADVPRNILTVLCGSADRYKAADANPGDTIGDITAIVQYAHARGYKAWVIIPPMWGQGIRSNWQPFHDALARNDAGADHVITLDGTPLQLNYALGDSTWFVEIPSDQNHPSGNGQSLLGWMVLRDLMTFP